MFTNTVFRVRTQEGASYQLRVCSPGWRTDEDLRSEAAWLQFLSAIPEINAPVPVMNRAGTFFVTTKGPGVELPCRCVLMSWLPGTLLAKHLTELNLERMGALFARLHASSLLFVPPPGFTRRKMSGIYARGEVDALFSEENQAAFTPETLAIFQQVDAKVKAGFQQLYADPHELRVIHNDLHHENINLYRGRLYPLDFEDTLWGYPVQDIAMALQDLWLEVNQDTYDRYLCAFQRGYSALAEWPERSTDQIDLFRAGRMLWVCNYVARFERAYLAEHVERVGRVFRRFLDCGQIRKV
jgi:Ser/Thr protein kinase RdoA (MazF antagonist)